MSGLLQHDLNCPCEIMQARRLPRRLGKPNSRKPMAVSGRKKSLNGRPVHFQRIDLAIASMPRGCPKETLAPVVASTHLYARLSLVMSLFEKCAMMPGISSSAVRCTSAAHLAGNTTRRASIRFVVTTIITSLTSSLRIAPRSDAVERVSRFGLVWRS